MAKIRQSNLDKSIITGNTELAESAAANDILLIYDATAGVIKKVLSSNVGVQGVTLTSISPTNVVSGDGTGNYTFTLTGTNFTGAAATLINNSGTAVAFDSVTVNSSTQITGVIAKSSLANAGEPYDVKVTGANNITAQLDNQINIDASPVFVTDAGSLGDVIVSVAGSFSVNATDPESVGNVTFELQSGSLPPSYTITNTAAEGGTAIIAGTDSTTSSTTTFNFVLRAVDAASNTSSRAFSIRSRVPVTESFTSSGTFAVPSGITAADVLVVAGGGSGDSTHQSGGGGGGGAGGLIFFPSYPVTPSGTITVTVGCGGPKPSSPSTGNFGQDSVLGSPGDPGLGQGGVLTAKGGAGANATTASAGGSGAGASNDGDSNNGGIANQTSQPGNSGAYGFGNAGGDAGGPGPYGNGSGGGGGGAGAVGAGGRGGQGGAPNGGNGGAGKAYTIADGTTSVYYAGGGGGGSGQTPGQGREGTGGQGGGTPGSSPDPSSHPGGSQNGTANRGGGSGGGNAPLNHGAGGKGVVIVRY